MGREMLEETNLDMIRDVNQLLYDLPLNPMYDGFLCNHPYYNSPHAMTRDGLVDLTEIKGYCKARAEMIEYIKEADLIRLYMLIREPYKLLWVKLCKDYLSSQDFAYYLYDAWITEDNPNMDVNVSRKESIEMFRSVDKKQLMTEADYEYYSNLPDKLTIWRGVSPKRIKLGLSWTDDYEKAVWFQHRFENQTGTKGRLFQVETPKKHILAYLNARGESELVTDVFKVQKKIVEVTNF